ncbi:MAG: acyl-CoA thioesterase [Casimicrobium sp.]
MESAVVTSRSQYKFFHRLRVRWAEVDLQRVVFNGNYLLYFDVAFTEFWRSTELPSVMAQNAEGRELFARKATIEYHGSAQFDDELDIGVRCAKLGRSSMTIALAIFRGDEHLIDGELVYVYADAQEKKSVEIPERWRAALEGR